MKTYILSAIVFGAFVSQQLLAHEATFPGLDAITVTNESKQIRFVATVPQVLPVLTNSLILLSVSNISSQDFPRVSSGTMGGFRFTLSDVHGRLIGMSGTGSNVFYTTDRVHPWDLNATGPLKPGWERWLICDMPRFVAPLAEGDYSLSVSWDPNAMSKMRSVASVSSHLGDNIHVEIIGIHVRLRNDLIMDLSDRPRVQRDNIANSGYSINEGPTAMKPLPRPPEITPEMEQEMLDNGIGTYDQLMEFRKQHKTETKPNAKNISSCTWYNITESR